MSKSNNVEVKKDQVTIQFKLDQSEYTDVQRSKIQEGKARETNASYYKEVFLRGLQESMV